MPLSKEMRPSRSICCYLIVMERRIVAGCGNLKAGCFAARARDVPGTARVKVFAAQKISAPSRWLQVDVHLPPRHPRMLLFDLNVD